MDKQLAIRLTHLVSTQTDPLKEYVDWRVERLHASLEMAKTLEELNSIQGQLREVRRLLHLRDEVLKAREDR